MRVKPPSAENLNSRRLCALTSGSCMFAEGGGDNSRTGMGSAIN
jgi:hypothetical protein